MKTIDKFYKVYKDYEVTKIISKSCKKFKMCTKTFKNYCKKLDLPSNLNVKCGDYSVFKTIDSHAKAYTLGFIAADGSVSYTKGVKTPVLSIKINSKDIAVLEFIKDTIGSNHKISVRAGGNAIIEGRVIKRSECATFYIRNTQLCEDLIDKGISVKKTHKLPMPNIDDKFFNSWLLGFLDGDGCIRNQSGRKVLQTSFTCADTDFLDNLNDKIEELYGVRGRWYASKKTAKDLRFNHKDSVVLLNNLYKNSPFYLKRKYEKFAPFRQK